MLLLLLIGTSTMLTNTCTQRIGVQAITFHLAPFLTWLITRDFRFYITILLSRHCLYWSYILFLIRKKVITSYKHWILLFQNFLVLPSHFGLLFLAWELWQKRSWLCPKWLAVVASSLRFLLCFIRLALNRLQCLACLQEITVHLLVLILKWIFWGWLRRRDHVLHTLEHFRIAPILSICLSSVLAGLFPVDIILLSLSIQDLLKYLSRILFVEWRGWILKYTLSLTLIWIFRIQIRMIFAIEILHCPSLEWIDFFAYSPLLFE